MTVTGHEDEFRRLFEREAGTRLTDLAEGAMELETGRRDPALVSGMFRAAHTLKGGAAVVGFAEVAAVVHELEQILEELRSGRREPDPPLVDAVLVTVDSVRAMVDCAMAGTAADNAAAAALAAIGAARGGRRTMRWRGDAPAGTELEAEGGPDDRGEAADDASLADPPPDARDRPLVAVPDLDPGAPPLDARDPPLAGQRATGPAPDVRERPLTAVPAGDETAPPPWGALAGYEEPATATTAPPPAARRPPPGAPPRTGAEVIPVPVGRLDELVRLVGESAAALLRVGRLLGDRLGDDPGTLDEYSELARVLQELQQRTMRARMVSVATVAAPLRRAVRDIARASGKQVRWELVGEDTELDRHVLEHLHEPLVALVRNAADHGVEPPEERAARGKPDEAVVRVHAMQLGADVVIAVSDDGRGIDVERVRASAGRPLSDTEALDAIFEAGLTTAERVSGVSGRGVGLDAVRSAVDELRGRVEVRSHAGRGTEFRISVPMTLAVLRCLLVRAGAERYALPMHSTATALPAADGAIGVEGRRVVLVDGDPVGLVPLAEILGAAPGGDDGRRPAPATVVLSTAAGRHAFGVDELVGQRDVVVKDLGGLLPRLPLLAGASVEPDGGIMLVLDPDGLIDAARRAVPAAIDGAVPPVPAAPAPPSGPAGRVLVVDDALTIRELERTILERAGYEVETAADGAAALDALAHRPADLVLCDVEMPGMDGLALTRAIRDTTALAATPVLILTSRDDDADRRAGMEAGADAYLVKSRFDEHALLTAVRRLLGQQAPA